MRYSARAITLNIAGHKVDIPVARANQRGLRLPLLIPEYDA